MLIHLRPVLRSILISNISPLYTDPTFAFLALFLFIQLKKLLFVKTSFARSNTSLMGFSLLILLFTVLVDSLFIPTVFLKQLFVQIGLEFFSVCFSALLGVKLTDIWRTVSIISVTFSRQFDEEMFGPYFHQC